MIQAQQYIEVNNLPQIPARKRKALLAALLATGGCFYTSPKAKQVWESFNLPNPGEGHKSLALKEVLHEFEEGVFMIPSDNNTLEIDFDLQSICRLKGGCEITASFHKWEGDVVKSSQTGTLIFSVPESFDTERLQNFWRAVFRRLPKVVSFGLEIADLQTLLQKAESSLRLKTPKTVEDYLLALEASKRWGSHYRD